MADNRLENLVSDVAEEIAEIAQDKARLLAIGKAWQFASWGQSPIEKLIWVAMSGAAAVDWVARHMEFHAPGSDLSKAPAGKAHFMAQAPIGKYRADIYCLVKRLNGTECRIVVECDGHDFHERTKEQAEHDRARDRWMTAEGMRVLRFTGSEIYRSPTGCMGEIISMAHKELNGGARGADSDN